MIATGKQLRDRGITQVLLFEESWSERYRSQLVHWFEARPKGFEFNGETLRFVALSRGVGQPHHHCAWGGASAGLIRTWMRANLIQVVGLTAATSAKTHAHLLRQYRKI